MPPYLHSLAAPSPSLFAGGGAFSLKGVQMDVIDCLEGMPRQWLVTEILRLRKELEDFILAEYVFAFDCGDHCPRNKQLTYRGAASLAILLSRTHGVKYTPEQARNWFDENRDRVKLEEV